MTARQPSIASTFAVNFGKPIFALSLAIGLAVALAATPAPAQTLTALHYLNGGSDGGGTITGVVADRQGNLYGAAYTGGIANCPYDSPGCGTIFKLTRHPGGWTFSVLYSFTGVSDGFWPNAVVVGADGTLYGTTSLGGDSNQCLGNGCGTVFRLQPPPAVCRSVSCSWVKTTLYQFTSGQDGRYPSVPTVDAAGNVYGTTNEAGENGSGTVWEVSPSHGGWTFNLLYALGINGGNPLNGVALDAAGNIWGSGDGGVPNCGPPYSEFDCGLIWKLTRSGSGWTFTPVFNLTHDTGGGPLGTFSFDQAGYMYGTLADSGPNGNGGVFQFNPSNGQMNLLYAAPGNLAVVNGPQGGVTMDSAGNLYAADPSNGAYDAGYVFKLTPSNGNWYFTDLHDFTGGGADRDDPCGPLVVDASGNVYGAAANLIFAIAP